MKFCLVSLGCQMNRSDSERVTSVLEGLGCERTDNEEEADLLGLVACSVRRRAIDRAYGRIRKWNRWKNGRNLLTFATGCVLPADRDRFLDLFDLVFDIGELPSFPRMIEQYGVTTPLSIHAVAPYASATRAPATPTHTAARQTSVTRAAATGAAATGAADAKRDFWRIRPSYASAFDAFVPIQNGCDKFCSFCAVPYTRGREVSRRSDQILAEVSDLVEKGYHSITILGQNVNSYGLDDPEHEIGFAELLRKVGEIGVASGREFRVYFTAPHPRDMSREVVEVVAEYRHLAKQFHLPLQSGDDEILNRMNRNYSVERYRGVVQAIREVMPEATLFTDIIVGFPGETEEQFERTRAAMREFRYNMAYIAMYSPRPGARSSTWDDDVPHDEKRRRLHELSRELKNISLAHNRRLIGRTLTVLVYERDRDDRYLTGRTEGKIIVRFPSGDDRLIGEFVPVTVTGAAEMSVEGELAVADRAAGRAAAARLRDARVTGARRIVS